MQKRARVDAALVNIQQLCSLGLQSEVVMSDLMEAVSGWMSADTVQFFWVDASLDPCDFQCRNSDLKSMSLFLELHDKLQSPDPEINSYREFLRGHRSMMHGGPESRIYYECTLYSEVMKHLGCECLLSLPVRDGTGTPRGSLSLGRTSRRTPFSALQRAQFEALTPHLSLLFAPETAAPGFERCDSQGMAIANAEGEILYCDAVARHLLFLAGHPKFRAEDGSKDRNPRLPAQIRGICESLRSIFGGRQSAAPRFSRRTPFGRFTFQARPLEPLAGGAGDLIALDVARYLPRPVLTWRAVRGHGLPPRLQQVCLEYVEGRSLTEISSKLGISRHTVIDHVNRLYERFGLEPSREALQEYLLDRS